MSRLLLLYRLRPCCSTGSAPRLDVPDNLLLLLHKHQLQRKSRQHLHSSGLKQSHVIINIFINSTTSLTLVSNVSQRVSEHLQMSQCKDLRTAVISFT